MFSKFILEESYSNFNKKYLSKRQTRNEKKKLWGLFGQKETMNPNFSKDFRMMRGIPQRI